ncbi:MULTISPECIES: RNA-directed DNA polymerase [Rhizobium]|uniref:RNA-directed DNA polymerase n=1 Tax=Rhizobium TaxID=379 RepID=UPI001C82B111|nr:MULTISPECIES: RNA-directed DNA polymerase [Rhizobium]MBX4958020.1 RNA-directed DNA polymerase [Rhizobium lentis]MBX4975951.1 RNA-directed DNA polymerase [Rhizobium lentis]MBX4987991.1 RNA-directed DNA polymerase [Rhizobium lentis]MBX5006419.1 RNA-directed DNA polymerase [Rhizobium lentis]MBX5036886.1 RNA-directed DNA polymerase [Rhizobium lentis]
MVAKNKSERLRRLLSHGYFAPELPPCFVSTDLARYRKAIFDRITSMAEIQQQPAYYRYITEPTWFYFPRFGKDDRRHGVPNPVSYLLLSKTISDNYVHLRRSARKSRLTASPPVFDWSGTRAVMRPSVDLRDDFRIDLSSRREEYVSADVRSFFHSIYTHSIPWAIYGKAWAKIPANRGYAHYGNVLDLLSRNLQGAQTIGLPVGPDTSRLLAELVASGIDEKLRERLGVTARDASRYIDDFTISGVNGERGEDIIAALRQAASHFELELNNEKSEINSTATRHNIGWKEAARAHIPRGNPDLSSMQQFFYEVGRLCEAHPTINVEKFAFACARTAIIRSSGWRTIQSLLINAYRRNSTLVSLVVEIFILRQIEHGDLDLTNLKDFLDHRLPALARANRTGEIIWLLFLAIRLGVVVGAYAAESLLQVDNGMVGLLAALAKSRDLIQGQFDLGLWNASHTSDGLKGPMWLYAYQTALQGIVPGINTAFVEQDPYFSPLFAKRVSFLRIENGFASVANTIRSLRDENERISRVRSDFLEDFTVNIEDYDDDDFEDLFEADADGADDVY